MALRITNGMMVNNSIANIAINKSQMNTLDKQLSSQKKISRPSEDPIVALRALRLRTSLAEAEQYLDRNIPDAVSWLEVTEGALQEANTVLESIYQLCVQGSTDTFSTDQRDIIVENLEQYKKTLYDQGNVDYAGRYCFTGYKTDSALTISTVEETNRHYTITEPLSNEFFDTKVIVKDPVDENTVQNIALADNPQVLEVRRIRLAYDNLDNIALDGIKYNGGNDTVAVTTVSYANPAAYEPASGTVNFIPETGELIFAEDVYEQLKTVDDMTITYDKTGFRTGEVKPEHYFTCVDNTNNKTYVKDPEGQDIEYQINFGQTIKVNTEACDSLDYRMARDIDELSEAVQSVIDIEAKLKKLETMKADMAYSSPADQASIDSMIVAANKERDILSDAMQKTFEKGVTKCQNHQQTISSAIADIGNREVRVNLTKNRLTEQTTNFEELKSNNEDIELEEVVINYSAAEVVYNASLTSAGKVVRQSLLDFI